VIESQHGLDSGGLEVVDEPAIVGDGCGIDWAETVRDDSRPGDREAIAGQPHLLHQHDVSEVLIAIVEVDGNSAGDPRSSKLMIVEVNIPDGGTLVVGSRRTFDLIGG